MWLWLIDLHLAEMILLTMAKSGLSFSLALFEFGDVTATGQEIARGIKHSLGFVLKHKNLLRSMGIVRLLDYITTKNVSFCRIHFPSFYDTGIFFDI